MSAPSSLRTAWPGLPGDRVRFACIILVCVIRGAACSASDPAADSFRPNIVFFLSDDQRSDHLGCAGNRLLQTPHLDQLAQRGVRFDHAFVTTSICAASRASFFTGMYERSHRYTFGARPLAPAVSGVAWPGLLRNSGYRTGFIGKFGIEVGPAVPNEWFDRWTPLNRTPYFKNLPDGTVRHVCDISGDQAIQFLRDTVNDVPFCLQISFNAGHAEDGDLQDHYPWPPAADDLYRDTVFPPPRLSDPRIYDAHPQFLKDSLNRERFFWRWDTPEKYQKNMRGYYRLLSGMDGVIGRVLDALEHQGLAENTVVIFASDNGYYMGSRGLAGKWSHYDESLRIPLIICDPRLPEARRGRVVSAMALNIDLAPTILQLAGVPIPEPYQGQSLVPLLDGVAVPNWRTDFFCEHLMQAGSRIPQWEGVRGEHFMYARYFGQQPVFEFLHNLDSDPDELVNLVAAGQASETLERMRQRCDELRDAWGGPWTPDGFPPKK